ncbi:2Fe-2S iron-sulfur cluster binding domain-containing protein [Endozoicomonas sp. SM1973]|uniref:2Fe-2S iron-sulfur cluster binding domain-containing protein n=1 Tax=Spartinivicinus marinus TaxID=2994442 RepID=A0A853I2G0_9GAMM|nr:adenylate/guanylate cyclase domain-containing protein [Spartinivicinus marinus]MCX4029344.1 2Fe-2S iron-sulfur cluster-binding protein [Spartinivicinus marinus]NYZ64918.1 2Fe-2S iron-sulfur cluster binding domain-containing protein [Spartinivicinus marinus]
MWQAKLRIISGLTLFAFVLTHLLNHAAGIISFQTQNQWQQWLLGPWQTDIGKVILLSAFVIHALNAVYSIYQHNSLKLAKWQLAQLITGLAIPFLLIEHIAGTFVAEELLRVNHEYMSVLAIFWHVDTTKAVTQVITLLVVWTHGCLGVHYWLRVHASYRKYQTSLLGIAVLIPTLALAGFISAGQQLLRDFSEEILLMHLAEANITADTTATISSWVSQGRWLLAAIILFPFVLRWLKRWLQQQATATITLANGQHIPLNREVTLLDNLRQYNISHAAVCGGRARCTTCRVRVLEGIDYIPPPSPLEQQALTKIKAPRDVRLACQSRPKGAITIQPLLAPKASPEESLKPGGLEGQEQEVAILFLDLRESTRLAEQRLPYDVLFILNQFFSEMTEALTQTQGHYAQFAGDGLMALYGIHGDNPQRACRQALKGAKTMLEKLDRLNRRVASELDKPLQIGIGLHFGRAIVGSMGPPTAEMVSAIGDDVNVAARLEGLSKQYQAPVIISAALAQQAGIKPPVTALHQASLKGRQDLVSCYALTKEDL